MTSQNNPQPNPPTKDGFTIKHIIAIILLLGYGVFLVFLLKQIETEEPTWTRMIMLFTSLEAIVFAAAGYVFGREVHKQRAETATTEKDKAEAKADEMEKELNEEKGKGRTLASIIYGQLHSSSPTQDVGNQKQEIQGLQAQSPTPQNDFILGKIKEYYPEI